MRQKYLIISNKFTHQFLSTYLKRHSKYRSKSELEVILVRAEYFLISNRFSNSFQIMIIILIHVANSCYALKSGCLYEMVKISFN